MLVIKELLKGINILVTLIWLYIDVSKNSLLLTLCVFRILAGLEREQRLPVLRQSGKAERRTGLS
ncbi:hypothetical protein [Bifidobacterium sp. ESL0732]|uniref:hypothetical protein n=1 Tax=Bifidobacterium sp. ESL0732 TaxID=2983222 RepID=UPI0023F6905E|nr:hypothetical protein [Bifidobacterium sp. ESL0732]WEV64011.1 hypothetical protein OZX70_08865 [Bifidobacterium sp. ESL0732]